MARRPDLRVVEFRGNVQTRLRKLSEGVAGATFLAMAGLNRLNMADVPRVPIAVDEMLPAVAQGAIGIERRSDDVRAAEMLEAIHDGPTGRRLAAERAFLAGLDGSCQTPIGGLAELDGGSLRLRGEILKTDGTKVLADEMGGAVEDGAEMGRAMARRLLERAGLGFFG
jgi:hydroxymethylbilane synthase